MTDWRVIRTGAVGLELTLWCGFGWGVDLFHAYARLGIGTIYISRFPLDRMLAMWRQARGKLAGIVERSGGMDALTVEPCSNSPEHEHELSQQQRDADGGTERRPGEWQPIGMIARRLVARAIAQRQARGGEEGRRTDG